MKYEWFCGCIEPNLKGKLRCFNSPLVCAVSVGTQGWRRLARGASATGRDAEAISRSVVGCCCLVTGCKRGLPRCNNSLSQHLRKREERSAECCFVLGIWRVRRAQFYCSFGWERLKKININTYLERGGGGEKEKGWMNFLSNITVASRVITCYSQSTIGSVELVTMDVRRIPSAGSSPSVCICQLFDFRRRADNIERDFYFFFRPSGYGLSDLISVPCSLTAGSRGSGESFGMWLHRELSPVALFPEF